LTFSVFELSCHLLLSVSSLKGKGNPVTCLAQRHTSELAGLSSQFPFGFNAERQVEKL